MLKPIQKTSLAGSVFEQVRDLILTGTLAPGEELPAERQLAETLGVNRSAVREALKRLEQAGLIAIHHGGNTRVLDYRRHAGLGVMGPLLGHQPGRAADVLALQAALLPEVCRAAAAHARAEQIDRLEMLAGLVGGEPDQQRDVTSEYWNVMVDASDNLAFRLVYNMIHRLGVAARTPTPDELADLTNAVAAGDTRGAALAAQAILR